MTAPPQPVPAGCDLCQHEPARMSLMDLSDYSQLRIGLGCAPEFLGRLLADMTGAAPAPEPRPGDPPAARSGPQEPAPAPAPDSMEPLIPEAEVTAPPAAAAVSPRRGAAARGGTPEAAQLAVLQLLGITRPDDAQCPECATTSYTAPGMGTFVCPWCGTFHGPGWAGLDRALTTPQPGLLVPDSEASTDLVPDTGEQVTEQAGHQAAAGPAAGETAARQAGQDTGVSRETPASEVPF